MNIIELKTQHPNPRPMQEIVTASPYEKALSALIRMKRNNIHHLPVVHENQLVGMVSDRDIFARALSVGVGDELSWLSVDQAMRREIIAVSENSEVGTVLDIMLKNKLSALPVVNHGVLSGVITESDLLKLTAKLLADQGKENLLPGSQYLANPMVQKVVSLLSDLGI